MTDDDFFFSDSVFSWVFRFLLCLDLWPLIFAFWLVVRLPEVLFERVMLSKGITERSPLLQ
jgi:hypothetical protein